MGKKGSWVVRMRCVVDKEVICDDCTEDQANSDPFEHAVSEEEIDQRDWEVLSVQENV